ncbi:DUF6461 domain-containing protein [Streptomyces sp. NPDC044780]|uniref:DUF6461 domain-containing protein n=1 Tax=unclassified Streptomyces TaxID=2593676 RepID=UPI0034020891
MNSGPDVWQWAASDRWPSFCLTLTRTKTSEEVLADYGADISGARRLSLEAALDTFPPNLGETLLRAGQRGDWSFCYEERQPMGYRSDVLGRLSTGTETVCVFSGGDGMRTVERWQDSQQIEQFEPGVEQTLAGNGPYELFRLIQTAVETVAVSDSRLVAALYVVGRYTEVVLDRPTLDGQLLTACLNAIPTQTTSQERPSLSPSARLRLGPPLGFKGRERPQS